MIYLITIITFKFFNYNIKIFIDFVVNNRNSRRIIVLIIIIFSLIFLIYFKDLIKDDE